MRPFGRWVVGGLLLALACAARAGSVEGPYLVWMNLGGEAHASADEAIRAFANGDDRLCWPRGALLYMRQRPAAVTPALVRRALVQRQAAAQRDLRRVLRQPFGEVSGFDGLVAYLPGRQPRLLSLSVGGRWKSDSVRSATGEMAWGPAFCNVLPPISRQP